MKVIILCGGIGSRMKDYSMPKPLNMIYGKPAIHYALKNLPNEVSELFFIYGAHLKKYNFEEIIVNLFKTRKCTFYCIEYFFLRKVAYKDLYPFELFHLSWF